MKSGFVMLAGRSNVGKSTLLNALVGSKVAIMSPKPQTTRHPVRGVLHDKRGQIVFVDTPGVFLGQKDHVSKKLNAFVGETLKGIDAIVYVTDPTRAPGPEEEHIQKLLRAAEQPIIYAVNKRDLPDKEKPYLEQARAVDVGQEGSVEISAKTHANLNLIVNKLFELLPEGEPFYPHLQITDLGHREWLEELIREKCFHALGQELPYTIKVIVDHIETGDRFRHIDATIYTTEDRYKGMIIGKGAQKLKEIGINVRKELEAVTGDKIYVELRVKVDPKWPQRFQ
ncbi:GTPase Era [Candidatus Uhrbacteria bacterium]|nr:GTPase Era [Candidatus Uhrbacteria bacterium]MBD3284514.1 GTPase Era [Candidatus Uhrbacteria bacterium]